MLFFRLTCPSSSPFCPAFLLPSPHSIFLPSLSFLPPSVLPFTLSSSLLSFFSFPFLIVCLIFFSLSSGHNIHSLFFFCFCFTPSQQCVLLTSLCLIFFFLSISTYFVYASVCLYFFLCVSFSLSVYSICASA